MSLKDKALRVIEGIGLLWDNSDKSVKTADEMMGDIYKFSHIAIGDCEHKDWEAEMDKMYKKLKKGKII